MKSKNIFFDEKTKLANLISKFDLIKDIPNKVAIIIDSNNLFKGLITSGDLRRITSKKFNLNTQIKKIMNPKPLILNLESKNRRQNLISVNNFFIKKNKNINFIIEVTKNKKFKSIISYDDFTQDFQNYKISIVGLGKVGLTLLTFLSQNHNVIDGIDTDKKLLKNLKKNNVDFFEPEVVPLLSKALKEKKIDFPNIYSSLHCNVIIICVGPNENSIHLKDQGIINVIKNISYKIKKNDLIILRSTSPIGLSRKAVKIIEKISGFKCGFDFYFSYSPERAVEGNIISDLKNIPQIISGYSDSCKIKAEKFWLDHCNSAILTDSLEAAEIIKLTNNTYRDFTFAFSNLLGIMCSKYNINTNNLIQSANSGYSRSSLFSPSPGVGGYCLSKDPYLFVEDLKDKKLSDSILTLRKLNEKMAIYPYTHIKKFSKINNINLKKIKILILGLAFKGLPENDDTRLSGSVMLMNYLIKKKLSVKFYDKMLINKKNKKFEKYKETKPINNFNKYNVFLIMNNHPSNAELIYKIIDKKINSKILIFDGWSQINPKLLNNNISYSCIGQYNNR